MIVEKLKELPPQVQIEGVWFDFKLEHDTPTSLLLSYEVVGAEHDSPHSYLVKQYSCWNNRYSDDNCTGFLWFQDSIETDEDLLNAIDECKKFLIKNELLNNKQ